LAIKLNVTNQKGGIDNIKAYEVLMRLKQRSEDQFVLTGYTTGDLEHIQMLAKFHTQVAQMQDEKENPPESDSLDKDDEIDENFCAELNKKWKVSTGDIFAVGNHRLICADSMKPETYAALLQGKKPRLVFSSPPYDNQRDYEMQEKLDWTQLMNNVSKSIFSLLESPADVLINLGPIYRDAEMQFYWNDWLDFCKKELENPLFGFYVWDKIEGAPGAWNGRLAPAHEFFFHFSFGRQSANKWIEKNDNSIKRGPVKTGLRNKDGSFNKLSSPEKLDQPFKIPESVVRIRKELARGIHTHGHPATFPVALPSFMIKTYSLIGDVVLEPFCGSGTTMVAAEELDRFCYAVEISPNYCALVLERMNREFKDLEIKKV
jgi:DNA modification methylase